MPAGRSRGLGGGERRRPGLEREPEERARGHALGDREAANRHLGPLTMLAGVAWGVLQPYRLTFLHPRGQGFWWLAIEPPLLVVAVGVAPLAASARRPARARVSARANRQTRRARRSATPIFTPASRSG